MTFIISSPEYLLHRTGARHPECPERSAIIVQVLKKTGLLTEHNHLAPRKANRDELLLCHTKEYIDLVEQEVTRCGEGDREKLALLSTGDVVISSASFEVACAAAGGVLTAVDAVALKKAKNAFCVVRPPGHHACSDIGMGFCLFNNVAIGARYAQSKYGIKRVLIVDWDVHHGNGTQEIFEADPSVFYFSTHQMGIYPGTGLEEDQGSGAALGTKMNCPILPGEDSKKAVLHAFKEKLVPAMQQFRPEFVFISCGFDAHLQDPLGGFNLTEKDFAELTEIVKEIARLYSQERLVSVLEGGYNLHAIARSSVEHCLALIRN